ncbi:acyltransferase family protein [Litoribrevibacter albus]|uniref:acyltransferase family protein n=1 Tax=Litoribrevibacter albus TaxID=1473156 RepID=UPI0024E16800|nr:acyltransferase [Litoribrevibacter albus]
MQYLNNFRGGAILAILFIHSISTISIGDSLFLSVLSKTLSGATFLFVMISGYFFARFSDGFKYFSYLKDKLAFVLVPYVVLSFPAAMIYVLGFKSSHTWMDMSWFGSLSSIEQYTYLLMTGAHLGPLWFIPMMVMFYLFSPVFFEICNKSLVLPVFVFSVIVSFIIGRPQFDNSPFLSFLYFLPAYILGFVIFYYHEVLVWFSKKSVLLLFLVLFMNLALSIYFSVVDNHVSVFYQVVFSFLLLAVFYRYYNYRLRWLDLFARLSFFIFFIHGYFSGLFRAGYKKIDYSGFEVLLVLFAFLVTVFLSLSVFVFLKLLLKNKTKTFIGA